MARPATWRYPSGPVAQSISTPSAGTLDVDDGGSRTGHSVQLESITHRFGATTAADDISLTIGRAS